MKINHLTTAEENLMHILWKLNTAYMKEVMEQLPEPKPHQNTVSTFMKILVEKGFLSTKKEGRIFKYTVAVPFEEYRKLALKNFIENYFNNSANDLVQVLKDEKLINSEETTAEKPEKSTSKKSENPIIDYIEELTSDKRKKKEKKKKGKKKK